MSILTNSNTPAHDQAVVVIINDRKVERKNLAECLQASKHDKTCGRVDKTLAIKSKVVDKQLQTEPETFAKKAQEVQKVAKMVNLKEKYPDATTIAESERWGC
jgi:hypothetical protein